MPEPINFGGIDGYTRTHGGQENGLEALILKHIRHEHRFRFAEIGVWSGGTAEHLLNKFPQMKYVGVDPYKTYSWCDRQELISTALAAANQRFAKFPNARLLVSTSESVAASFPDKHFHVVFIDGCHDYESVKNDIRLWLPKTGVVLAGHDYVGVAPVKQAVDEFAGQVGVKPQFETGDVWYFLLAEGGLSLPPAR